MSSKYSIFVDELMIGIIFVVDILREYADSRKFWRQYNLDHWSTHLDLKIALLAKNLLIRYHNRGCAQQRNFF